MIPSSISITGLGAYTCAGKTAATLWSRTLLGQSGIRDGIGRIEESTQFDTRDQNSRMIFFSATAAREAMASAGWGELTVEDGLILATTTGRVSQWENQIVDYLRGEMEPEQFAKYFRTQPLGSALDALKDEIGFRGRTLLVSSACSAGTQAVALGAMWIRQGRAKRVLVVGAEVLCQLTLAGFKSLQLLAPEGARPFDRDRHGINLSEGAGAICLETESSHALANLSGYGLSTDGYHMTSPHPEGLGSYQSMRRALEMARIRPDEISWVHAHGTGSKHNDAAEGAAVSHLFSEIRDGPFVSSTKGIHGHVLGASGIIETVLCVQAITNGIILPTSGLNHPDPEIRIKHPESPVSMSVRHILKNTLGFGGSNASLVLSEVTP